MEVQTSSDASHQPPATSHSQADDEISLLDILIVLAKHKKLILGLPFLVAVVTAGITLLMPNWYTATAKLLPPQQSQSNAVAILGQLGALSGGASSALGLKNPSDIFVAMLKSRTVADAIIERFNLKEVYDQKYLQDTRRILSRNADITAARDGVITIEVDDKNQQRAADISNAYVEELEKLTLRLAIGEAGQRRLFFEKQLQKSKQELANAEVEMQKLQERTGIINPTGQASLSVAAAAGLRAQITAKEVQLSALRTFATDQNPDLMRTERELEGLRVELAKTGKASDEKGDVLVGIGKVPGASLEFIKKFRDVKYYETLFELLAKQYEIAKIDEAKEATLIQVLDKAIEPERKSKPKRSLIVVLCTLTAGLLSIFGAFVREAMDKVPEQSQRLIRLKAYLRIRHH
jgi:tyrosine-protein kinase Etk/Wzc